MTKKIITLNDIKKDVVQCDYYCLNIYEKTFECQNQMKYIKYGGFGLNYKYCASCYTKWNNPTKFTRRKNDDPFLD